MTIKLDALGETRPFEGFVDEDFDAFEQKKWSSRVYTMARRTARQKLVAIARALLDSNPDRSERYELGASDDAPSIANHRKVDAVWAYLTRPPELRTAISSRLSKINLADTDALFDLALEHKHASLLLLLNYQGFRLDVHLSPRAGVDRTNAATKLGYQDDQNELARLCEGLSAETRVGFLDELKSPKEVTPQLAKSWGESFGSSSEPFVVRRDWPREDSRLSGLDLLAELNPDFLAFADILDFLAWSRDNDFAKVGVEQALQRAEKKIKKASSLPPAGSSKTPDLTPGARVTILSGLFAGRAGYLAEQDGKGKVKVMVGPVSVSVALEDLKLE